jgi:iron(III) transport system substrate-binding protein
MKMKKNILLLSVITLVVIVSTISAGIYIISQNTKKSAKKKNVVENVVVYSPHCGDERGEFIKSKAKEEVGLTVECMSAGGGAIADRLNNEKNDPQADVVMALNQVFMYQLKDNGVLAKYVPSWNSEIPSKYKDNGGYFYGLGRTPILIAYNKQFITAADAPKGWLSLINSKYANKYSLAPIENQTTRVYLASMLWRYYDKNTKEISDNGWSFMKNLYSNSYSYANVSWDDVKTGITPILIDWYGNIKKQSKNYGIDIGYVDDPTGSPIVAESMAKINNSPNSENGKKFIEWFGSSSMQAPYAKKFFSFGQVPLNTKALELSSDDIKNDSKRFHEQNIDYATMSKNLNEWLRKIELEIK